MCVYNRSPFSYECESTIIFQNIVWADTNFSGVVLVGIYNLLTIGWYSELPIGEYAKDFARCLYRGKLDQLVGQLTRNRGGQQFSLLYLLIVSEPDSLREITHETHSEWPRGIMKCSPSQYWIVTPRKGLSDIGATTGNKTRILFEVYLENSTGEVS